MWQYILPAVIGAGASLLGGSKANKSAMQTAQANMDFQKEFAKHGISWKVADAREAGISPLVALGAQTHSFSPIYMPASDKGISKAGQDISRAMNAYLDRDSRLLRKVQLLKENEILRGLKIDNDKKEIQPIQQPDTLQGLGVITDPRNVSMTRLGDFDLTGQGVEYQNKKGPKSMAVGIEAGILPLEAYEVDRDGYLWLKPNKDNQDYFSELGWDSLKYNVVLRPKAFAVANYRWWFHKDYRAKEHRDFMRIIRPKPDNPETYEYRLNPRRGWKLYRKRHDRDSFFYEDKRGGYKN